MILIVEDMDRTLDFYTQVLGLRLGHRAGDYAQMETGTTRLGFYTRTAYVRDPDGHLSELAQELGARA